LIHHRFQSENKLMASSFLFSQLACHGRQQPPLKRAGSHQTGAGTEQQKPPLAVRRVHQGLAVGLSLLVLFLKLGSS
jgi:hypothetical protein